MKNKTAVEWMIEQISNDFFDMPCCVKSETIKEALEIEKQQIIDAANIPKEQRWYDEDKYNSCGEKYYSETYNKPKQ